MAVYDSEGSINSDDSDDIEDVEENEHIADDSDNLQYLCMFLFLNVFMLCISLLSK